MRARSPGRRGRHITDYCKRLLHGSHSCHGQIRLTVTDILRGVQNKVRSRLLRPQPRHFIPDHHFDHDLHSRFGLPSEFAMSLTRIAATFGYIGGT